MSIESITCPICARTSFHPKDIEYGWCGECKAVTTKVGDGWEEESRTLQAMLYGYTEKEQAEGFDELKALVDEFNQNSPNRFFISYPSWMTSAFGHDHVTRDIKPYGQCYGCDLHHHIELERRKSR